MDNTISMLNRVCGFAGSIPFKPGFDPKLFRKRTAPDILESGYVKGCTDTAKVFAYVTRTFRYPTLYVEATKKDWIEEYKAGSGDISEHIFCDVFANERWIPFDPSRGATKIKDDCYMMGDGKDGIPYVVLCKGLNFNEMHLEIDGVLEKEKTRMTSLEDIRKAMRKKYHL
jgi:hypothetical protein